MPVQFSPYEADLQEQVNALEAQLAYTLPPALGELDLHAFGRIVLSGMGSSDYATIPIERELLAMGLPVWRVDAGKLLDTPELITSDTLLWLTSQSGMSGEIVALLEVLKGDKRPATIIGVTNGETSELAKQSDILVTLKSGHEATVSAKSYLNTLVAQYRVFLALTGQSEAPLLAELTAYLPQIAGLIAEDAFVHPLTQTLFRHLQPRIALIGTGADGTTVMTGALILKEASKMTAEGYLGGEFRHGPMETSGEGMLALLIGDKGSETLARLAEELDANGTTVVTIGPERYGNGLHLLTSSGETLLRLISGMLYIQHMTVALAKAKGLEPGKFFYGQKITVKI
ncbi:SIS domain-containing protein [Klebsiella sp. I138]|uniref:SIS domain-containing protein n=1 Tax=Klebsiella sp. I138 TaxID=2755385 RepID=UPI003DA8F0EE